MKKVLKVILALLIAGAMSALFTACSDSDVVIKKDTADTTVIDEDTSAVDTNTDDYTFELKRNSVSVPEGMGTVICKNEDKVVWEYTTGKYPRTELEPISDLCYDETKVYLCEGGNLVALDKATGDKVWEAEKVLGYATRLLLDDKNIYASSYYGPNVAIFNKDGEQLYLDDDNSYYHVDRLEIKGNTLYIYYWGSSTEQISIDEPAVKELDITPYL